LARKVAGRGYRRAGGALFEESVSVSVENFDKITDAYTDPVDPPTIDTVKRLLSRFGRYYLVPRLLRRTPIGIGRLRGSTRQRVVYTPDPYPDNPDNKSLALVITQSASNPPSFGGAEYMQYVASGRLPGRMPPSRALEPWVRAKLGVPANRVRYVAYAVARAIGRRGIQPNNYLMDVVTESRKDLQNLADSIAMSITIGINERIPIIDDTPPSQSTSVS